MAPLNNIDPDANYFNVENQCIYYDLENFESFISKENSFNVLHINIRSVNKNFDEFVVNMKNVGTSFSVIILTETWLRSTHDWMEMPGYEAFHSVREGRMGGGVTALVRSDLSAEIMPNVTINNDCYESVGVSVMDRRKNFNILGVYRPPSRPLEVFNREFFNMLTGVGMRGTVVVAGDFNVDILALSPSGPVASFVDHFRSEHMIPLITIPTRIANNSESCIDHIYVNTLLPCKSGVLKLLVSDHFATVCSIPLMDSEKCGSKKVRFRDYSPCNLDKFKSDVLRSMNTFHFYDNIAIGDRFEIFNNVLLSLFEKNFPIKHKTISVKRLGSPWITDSLLRCINEKHRLYRLSRENPMYNDSYKSYRNTLCNNIKRAKLNYYKNKFDGNSDTKSTWKSINAILKPNPRRNDIKLEEGDNLTEDPLMVSNIFNDYFSTVAQNLASSIPMTNSDPLSNVRRVESTFVYFETSPDEIDKLISSFPSKRSNLYSIPSFVYKYISQIISPVLALLINMSVREGYFPEFMKIARVVPIHKSGSRSMKSNYRPISTLPFLSKVFERLIHGRLLKFFNKYKVLYSDQYGFLKNRSTTDAILKFTDCCCSSLNEGSYLMSIFLDFSKAFDTIEHSILIRKLEYSGIRGFMLEWFRSYLTGRTQYVDICGNSSRKAHITCSVPQGSILGPLCFLVYVNDMNSSSNLNFIHFADDSTVFLRGSSIDAMVTEANAELIKINDWLCANRLSLNVSKCSYTVFTNKKMTNLPVLLIRDQSISYVTSVKFLGVEIDNRLSFSVHVSGICSKISKSYAIMRRISKFVPDSVIRKLYMSLVYPYVIYGVEVWGGSGKTGLSRLRAIMDKCIRMFDVEGGGRDDMHMRLGVLCFDRVYEYFCLVRLFCYLRLDMAEHFRLQYVDCMAVHDIETRAKCNLNLNLPVVHTSKYLNSFIVNSIKFWNELPVDAKQATNAKSFKKYLKAKFLN